MKLLNNKGYMLVEIVLASVLAMIVAYFITDLTIKLKNKNDDLLVKTLVASDQAIIYNTIMKDLYNTNDLVDCDYIKNKLTINGNVFKYGDFTNIVSEYANISNYQCSGSGDNLSLKIPMDVPQLEDNFDIVISSKFGSGIVIPLSCSLSVDSSTNVITALVNNTQNLSYYGWDSNMESDNNVLTKKISGADTYTYYLKNIKGETATCEMSVVKTKVTNTCPSGYSKCTSGSCKCYKKYAATVADTIVSGSCTCRGTNAATDGYIYGVCDEDGCSCASGLTVRTDNCSVKKTYECDLSSDSLSGTNCYRYKNYSKTTYSCSDSSYTKLNTSYCYK